jgi:hypothetical protein
VAAERGVQWDEANREHIARHRITTLEFEEALANNPIEIANIPWLENRVCMLSA